MGGSVRKTLIVGGGIAGITLALSLKKQAIKAEIAEISSEWRSLDLASRCSGRQCARSRPSDCSTPVCKRASVMQ